MRHSGGDRTDPAQLAGLAAPSGQGPPRHTEHGAPGQARASGWAAPIMCAGWARAGRAGAARSRGRTRPRQGRPGRRRGQTFARPARWTSGTIVGDAAGRSAAVGLSLVSMTHVARLALVPWAIGVASSLVHRR